jgi:hypothetical protein
MPMYNEIVRIPLVVHLPGGRSAGSRVGALTQTIDLMPTFLDAFGCEPPPHVRGKSILGAIKGDALREDAIFGYFGMAMNITDGRHVYMRNPVNADGGPLYKYTAMPVGGLNSWIPREVYGSIEMGRYFGHTYNMPLYKIPTTGSIPVHHDGETSYQGRNVLYDIVADPLQASPLNNAALEARFAQRIAAHLKSYEASSEQFTRLGLSA